MTRIARVIVGGIAVAVTTAEIRKRGSVCAVRTGVVVGGVAGIVPRLEAVKARVAVVGTLIQDRRDRRDARSSASFTILRYFYDYRGLARATNKCKIEKSDIIFSPHYSISFGSFTRQTYKKSKNLSIKEVNSRLYIGI